MPRVVMSNHRVDINKTTLRDHTQKKDAKSRGFLQYYQTDAHYPKSCPNDRNHIAVLWMPDIQIHFY